MSIFRRRWFPAESVVYHNSVRKSANEVVLEALASGCSLVGADLRGANLHGASFRNIDLRYADLSYATLSHADFYGAHVDGTLFCHANLRSASLFATRGQANYRGAEFDGAGIKWSCHAQLSAILENEAGEDVCRSAAAALVGLKTEWCWGAFMEAMRPEEKSWALDVLRKYVRPCDLAPKELAQTQSCSQAHSPQNVLPGLTEYPQPLHLAGSETV